MRVASVYPMMFLYLIIVVLRWLEVLLEGSRDQRLRTQ
jgi:hypothetical protein